MRNRSRLLLRLSAVLAIAVTAGWRAPSVAGTATTCPATSYICNECPSNLQAACTIQCRTAGGPTCVPLSEKCEITGDGGCSISSQSVMCVCATD
jgi:hypothetical protein